ncbi:putative nucleotidyltransferase [Streptacidiphilus sp. BW17]
MTGAVEATIEARIARMARQLTGVHGVVGVMLGGSRARGEARPESDWDLGVYYRGTLDLDALRALAAAAEPRAEVPGDEVAGPGGWGPWVNGGAWLTVDGVPVDWILRDVDRVRRIWDDCRAGRYEVGIQPGHPLGFWSPCYPGEVALGRVLADPFGELAALRAETRDYPEPLRQALCDAAWESEFLCANARKSAARGDVLHTSLCLSRAVGVLTQSLFAHARRWYLNEKGAFAVAATLPAAPPDFTGRAARLLGAAGTTGELLTATIAEAEELVADVRERLASKD